MVVVFGHEYLQKLWTVYELATYLSLGSSSRIALCPPFMTKLVLIGMGLLWAGRIAERVALVFYPPLENVLMGGSLFLLCGTISIIFRLWSRSVQGLRSPEPSVDNPKG